MLRSSREVHALQSHPNSARGDNDHLVTIFAESDSSLDNQGEDGQEWLMGFLVDDGTRAYNVLERFPWLFQVMLYTDRVLPSLITMVGCFFMVAEVAE